MVNYVFGLFVQTEPKRPVGAPSYSVSPAVYGHADSDRGSASVVGQVESFGTAVVTRVVLHNHRTRRIVKSTDSDETGFFAFRNLPYGVRYFLAAKDPNGIYEDDISGPHVSQ